MRRVTKEYCVDERGTARWVVSRYDGDRLWGSHCFPPYSEKAADAAMRQEIEIMKNRD